MLLLGLIGHPVAHSVSPAMHQAAMKELGIEGAYLAFDVLPDNLRDAVFGARALGFRGLNITIPHKETVARYLRLKDEAEAIKAVNTIKPDDMTGYNTDAYGAMKALEEEGFRARGRRCLIVGAGGAAKAIGYGLITAGAKLVVTNRTPSRGIELANFLRKFGPCTFLHFDKLHELRGRISLIVNATPLGMKGFEERLPVPASLLERVTVFDTVYNPMETLLIREAKKRGCRVVYGIEMLVHQGAKSFEIWTGMKPPVEAMREAAVKALGGEGVH